MLKFGKKVYLGKMYGLSLYRHVSTVSTSGFYWLRQLQRSQRPHLFTLSYRHALTAVTLSWRVRRKWRRTGYNECSMPLPVSAVVRRSTTEVCCGCCTLSCIGSMYPSESSTSSASWCTAVWKAKHPSTWPTSATTLCSHISAASQIRQPTNFWTYHATKNCY